MFGESMIPLMGVRSSQSPVPVRRRSLHQTKDPPTETKSTSAASIPDSSLRGQWWATSATEAKYKAETVASPKMQEIPGYEASRIDEIVQSRLNHSLQAVLSDEAFDNRLEDALQAALLHKAFDSGLERALQAVLLDKAFDSGLEKAVQAAIVDPAFDERLQRGLKATLFDEVFDARLQHSVREVLDGDVGTRRILNMLEGRVSNMVEASVQNAMGRVRRDTPTGSDVSGLKAVQDEIGSLSREIRTVASDVATLRGEHEGQAASTSRAMQEGFGAVHLAQRELESASGALREEAEASHKVHSSRAEKLESALQMDQERYSLRISQLENDLGDLRRLLEVKGDGALPSAKPRDIQEAGENASNALHAPIIAILEERAADIMAISEEVLSSLMKEGEVHAEFLEAVQCERRAMAEISEAVLEERHEDSEARAELRRALEEKHLACSQLVDGFTMEWKAKSDSHSSELSQIRRFLEDKQEAAARAAPDDAEGPLDSDRQAKTQEVRDILLPLGGSKKLKGPGSVPLLNENIDVQRGPPELTRSESSSSYFGSGTESQKLRVSLIRSALSTDRLSDNDNLLMAGIQQPTSPQECRVALVKFAIGRGTVFSFSEAVSKTSSKASATSPPQKQADEAYVLARNFSRADDSPGDLSGTGSSAQAARTLVTQPADIEESPMPSAEAARLRTALVRRSLHGGDGEVSVSRQPSGNDSNYLLPKSSFRSDSGDELQLRPVEDLDPPMGADLGGTSSP